MSPNTKEKGDMAISAPVSLKEVADTLGETDYKLSTICKSTSVNLYSKCKPANWKSTLHDHVGDWYNMNNDKTGLKITNVLMANNTLASNELTIENILAAVAENWNTRQSGAYPTGGSASAYRLGDFWQYNHDEKVPFNIDDTAIDSHWQREAGDTTYYVVRPYGSSYSDLEHLFTSITINWSNEFVKYSNVLSATTDSNSKSIFSGNHIAFKDLAYFFDGTYSSYQDYAGVLIVIPYLYVDAQRYYCFWYTYQVTSSTIYVDLSNVDLSSISSAMATELGYSTLLDFIIDKKDDTYIIPVISSIATNAWKYLVYTSEDVSTTGAGIEFILPSSQSMIPYYHGIDILNLHVTSVAMPYWSFSGTFYVYTTDTGSGNMGNICICVPATLWIQDFLTAYTHKYTDGQWVDSLGKYVHNTDVNVNDPTSISTSAVDAYVSFYTYQYSTGSSLTKEYYATMGNLLPTSQNTATSRTIDDTLLTSTYKTITNKNMMTCYVQAHETIRKTGGAIRISMKVVIPDENYTETSYITMGTFYYDDIPKAYSASSQCYFTKTKTIPVG